MKKKEEATLCYTEVIAQNYLKMEEGAEIAVVSYTRDGIKRSERVPYEDLQNLSLRIWFGIQTKPNYKLDETTVKLPDGNEYRWNETYAHYTFAKGRINEETFVELQFSEDNKL